MWILEFCFVKTNIGLSVVGWLLVVLGIGLYDFRAGLIAGGALILLFVLFEIGLRVLRKSEGSE